jgi:predicted Zn-dependent protease
MPFKADYFDGRSARTHPVTVEITRGESPGINILIDNAALSYPLPVISIEPKLGSSKRIINLPCGGRLEALDISELENLLKSSSHKFHAFIHYLENHLGWIMAALLLTVAAGWTFIEYGVPKLAEFVVNQTPPVMEISLGEQVLNGLDQKLGYFSPSKTAQAKKDSISTALKSMCAALSDCPWYRLQFRDGGEIGANAFALPGGIIVVTDQLIELAQTDTEIVAVLAHELGHVKQRHAFRQSIQSVLSGLILAAITGDVSSSASGLSGFLIEMRYSQAHETQADTFALAALKKSCLPPKAYADILQRLEKELTVASNENENNPDKSLENKIDSLGVMLSTHPNTSMRIKPFLASKDTCSR